MAEGNFSSCLAFTLQQEGGFSDNPADAGGRTMRGVTQTTYDAWRAQRLMQPGDVAQITNGELQVIYKSDYWDAIKADDLAFGVDLCSFDYAVNSGSQRALAELAKAAVPGASAAQIINTISSDRLSFLHALRTWSHFGGSWGKRVAACEALALIMASVSLAPVAADARKTQTHYGAKATGAVTVGAGGAVAAKVFASGNLWVVGVLGALALIVAAFNAFMAWRQGQRRNALDAALVDMAAKKKALDASKLAEAAQKAAVAANIAKQQQQIKIADQAEAALNNPTPVSAAPVNSLPVGAKRI